MITHIPDAISRQAWLLKNYSLEMTAKDIGNLAAAAGEIAAGTRISVTYLPNETAPDRLTAANSAIDLGFRPIPHISARRLNSEAELTSYLAGMEQMAIQSALVIGGDLSRPDGPYQDALAVIRSGHLARRGVNTVAIAGYPEGHPDINPARLDAALHDKRAALADQGLACEIITQFGFDAEPIDTWLRDIRDRGIENPVRIGIPGPASARILLRFAARCGVGASAKVIAKYGLSLSKLLGTAGPEKLLDDLADLLAPASHGNVSLHFYPFGGFTNTARWVDDYYRKHN